MKVDVRNMLLKVMFFDVIVGTILSMLVYMFTKSNMAFCIIGLVVAFACLVINAVITERIVMKDDIKHNLYSLMSTIIRASIVCVIGIAIYTYNNFSMIFYILGYSSQFAALMLYSLFNTNKIEQE